MFQGLKKKFVELYGTDLQIDLKLGEPTAPLTSGLARLRDSLFGDAPLDEVLGSISPEAQASGSFAIFARATKAQNAGQMDEAVALLKTLTEGQEARVELLAWAALKGMGVIPPPERSKEVLGVIVEVAMGSGEDLVAAYAEHTARYYNYSGAGVVWETDNPRLNPQIDALLDAARKVVAVIGPWEQKRPAVPQAGHVRLNMLTPSGLHFGEGPMDGMSRDPMAGPMIRAAVDLMQTLITVDAEFRNSKQKLS